MLRKSPLEIHVLDDPAKNLGRSIGDFVFEVRVNAA
jgi:hypothetical protein